MFKLLRSKAKIFYWVIAGSFILFLFLGGMTGRGCQAPGTSNLEPGVIGTVSGNQISGQQYDFAVRQQIAQMRQQSNNQPMTSNQYEIARQRAWDALVQSLIVDQAIAERGINVSDEEILDAFRNNPPPELLNQYRDENGQVNMDAYYAALANPNNDWTAAEAYIRETIPRQKLTDEIAAGAFVAELEVREEFIRQTGRAVAEYMGVLFADVGADYEPSEEDILAWYNSHSDEYQAAEQAQVKVVRFAKVASEADEAEVLQDINVLRDLITSGRQEFSIVASENSEDATSAIRGGDLGRFGRDRMVDAFSDVAFELPIGELSQPVKTQFGYHLIEVTEREVDETSGEVYEITARHILLKIKPGPSTLDIIQESASAFADRVDGNNFVTTAEAEALDLVSPGAFPAGRDIPSIANSLQGSAWAFQAEVGDVSQVFENDDAFYIVLNESQVPAGTRPLEDVRGQVTLGLRNEHNLELAKAKLQPAVAEVQQGGTLADVAATATLTRAVTDTFTANGNVDGVGYGTDFNMEVIRGTVGELLPEIETLRGVFAAVPLWVDEIDQANFDQRASGIRTALQQRAQGEVINEWFTVQMESADIVDQRYRTN